MTELKADDFFFRTTAKTDNEGVADVTDLTYPGKLWTEENWQLSPGETKEFEGRLKLKGGDEYQGAELRAVVYLSDIDQPDQMRVVQRRLLQIRNVVDFKPHARGHWANTQVPARPIRTEQCPNQHERLIMFCEPKSSM